MSPIAAVGILGVAFLPWGVLAHNLLICLRVRAEESWRDIDSQLKRRWDSIPNPVTAIQGYLTHESDVFEQVTTAQTRSSEASSSRGQAEAEEGPRDTVTSLFAIVESYPQFQASVNFMQPQQTLKRVEDAIQHSRRYCNAVVRAFTLSIPVFPRSLIGGLFGFDKPRFYSLTDEGERASASVRFK